MARAAIISVDGHVKASHAGFRSYIEQRHLDDYDAWVKALQDAGQADVANLRPQIALESQWDSAYRLEALETQGVVAEVLFPNGLPFQKSSFDDFGRIDDPDLAKTARHAYNRWLVDFCGEAPGRRAGQALVSFDDIEQAVADVVWAKEQGLMGIELPPLFTGDPYFFDPALDPVWAVCQDVGLPVTQHGGAGQPEYTPGGFAAMMTISIENAFFSNRSLWQMILGGVFERFPDLRAAFIETQVFLMAAAIERLDQSLSWGDDWVDFAEFLNREKPVTRLVSEYFSSNCSVGVSPFDPRQITMDQLVGKDDRHNPLPGFHIGPDNAMFGVDFPHFESTFPATMRKVADLVGAPCVTDDDARKILYENAVTVFGFDMAVLQPHIDRIGFELSDVAVTTAA